MLCNPVAVSLDTIISKPWKIESSSQIFLLISAWVVELVFRMATWSCFISISCLLGLHSPGLPLPQRFSWFCAILLSSYPVSFSLPFVLFFPFFFLERWKKFEFLLDFVDNIMHWSLGAWWLLHTWMASHWCLCNAIFWLLIKDDIFLKNCEESYFETGPLKATNHLWSSFQSYFSCLIVLFDRKSGCCLKCQNAQEESTTTVGVVLKSSR